MFSSSGDASSGEEAKNQQVERDARLNQEERKGLGQVIASSQESNNFDSELSGLSEG